MSGLIAREHGTAVGRGHRRKIPLSEGARMSNQFVLSPFLFGVCPKVGTDPGDSLEKPERLPEHSPGFPTLGLWIKSPRTLKGFRKGNGPTRVGCPANAPKERGGGSRGLRVSGCQKDWPDPVLLLRNERPISRTDLFDSWPLLHNCQNSFLTPFF